MPCAVNATYSFATVLILGLLFFAFSSRLVHNTLAKIPTLGGYLFDEQGFAKIGTSVVIGLVGGLIAMALSKAYCKNEEAFTFKVSENRPSCSKGFNGKPISFEYTMPGSEPCTKDA